MSEQFVQIDPNRKEDYLNQIARVFQGNYRSDVFAKSYSFEDWRNNFRRGTFLDMVERFVASAEPDTGRIDLEPLEQSFKAEIGPKYRQETFDETVAFLRIGEWDKLKKKKL